MTNEIRTKAIELAASYYANWQVCEAEMEYSEGREYRNRYEGALRMAILLGVDNGDGENAIESEIKDTAYRLWGDEIRKAYEANNATW